MNVNLGAGETFGVVAGAGRPDAATVGFDHTLGNCQAQTGPGPHKFGGTGGVGGGAADSEKLFKNQFEMFGFDAHAGIGHAHFEGFGLAAFANVLPADFNVAAVGRELDGVADDLSESLSQPVLVGLQAGQRSNVVGS